MFVNLNLPGSPVIHELDVAVSWTEADVAGSFDIPILGQELELAPLLLAAHKKVVDELRKPDHPKSLQI